MVKDVVGVVDPSLALLGHGMQVNSMLLAASRNITLQVG